MVMLKMQDNLTQDRTEEIKRELFELQNTLKMSVQKAIRIGELLTEAEGVRRSWSVSSLAGKEFRDDGEDGAKIHESLCLP